MGALEPDPLELDLLASALRADLSDIAVFIEGLATKLEGALPGLVEVERVRQGFRGPKLVARIALDAGDGQRLELRRAGTRLEPLRARVSGGIVLKTEPLALDDWLRLLAQAMSSLAARSERTRQALEQLLTG